jgi:hypothetical protein
VSLLLVLVTAALNLVAVVVSVRSDEEVFGVHARWVVADMPDQQTTPDRAVVVREHDPVYFDIVEDSIA